MKALPKDPVPPVTRIEETESRTGSKLVGGQLGLRIGPESESGNGRAEGVMALMVCNARSPGEGAARWRESR
jgi:hypothetical protein